MAPTTPAKPQTTPASAAPAASAPKMTALAMPPSVAPPPAPPAATKGPGVDVVRVDPQGSLVMAGSAAPGTTVTITNDKNVIGEITSDSNGQWVFLPDAPLAPGVHELHLTTPGTKTVGPGSSTVLLTVPGVVAALAPKSAGATETPQGAAPQSPQGSVADNTVQKVIPAESPPGGVSTPSAPGSVAMSQSGAPPANPPSSIGPSGSLVVLSQGNAPPRLLQPVPGSHPGPVGLDIVQYDQQGHIRFVGHAAPGRSVRLYVDNKAVGDAEADASGQWQLSPIDELKSGVHKLRADELSASGKVAARTEVPFARADLAHLLLPGQAIVQPGDSLWLISRHSFGHGTEYTAIFKENTDQIRDPDLIYPGQTFHMPTADEAAHAPPLPPWHKMAHHHKS
ncbi:MULTISPECIES: LysM peptidoglycan-binding domain-containing protein [unclassified Acidisoma]|uniref:LysM peptidoglycan-binding domain-containing protein n=1 Tax=unclassified Acidisoma TaxID=2634065 RepID=UPI00131CE102|nr:MULTISPECIES: LysM peptidoglycan-binding domain-containing protein [unclassified Acidisoma]